MSPFSITMFLLAAIILVVAQAGCPGMMDMDTMDRHPRELQSLGTGGGGGNAMGGGMIGQLFDNRMSMNRTVEYYENGTIVALTESDTPSVATLLKEHLAHMQWRMANGIQARSWDPFFVAWFEKYNEFTVDVVNTTDGVLVTMSALTDCGQALLDGHTAVVDLFVETGREEGTKTHAIPVVCLPPTAAPTTSPTAAPTTSPTDTPSATPVEDGSAAVARDTMVLAVLVAVATTALTVLAM